MTADRRIVQVEAGVEDAELVADVLWRCGPSAVSETPLEGQRVRLEADVTDLGPLAALPAGCTVAERDLPDDAYLDTWRAWATPVRVGDRLVLRPAWLAEEGTKLEPGDLVVRIDPGRAFGSGAHPTTRLVLALLERTLHAGDRILDVGTGSGVLAVTAALLGAGAVTATDIDPAAIVATRSNAAANGVAERVVVDDAPLHDVPGTFDVVVANIGAGVLQDLADGLTDHVAPGGTLILSGLLAGQADAVVARFPGFTEQARPSLEGWVASLLRAPG